MQDHYENIAKIIVRANKIRQMEADSAKSDYDDLQNYLREETDFTDKFGKDANGNIREYSAYLNRRGEGIKTADKLANEVKRASNRNSLITKIQDVFGKMGTHELALKDSEKEYEAEYERERDEIEDYYYNWKNELEEKAAAEKSSSSSKKSSSLKKTSSSGKTSSKKTTKVDNTAYIDLMPEFKSATGITEGLTNEVYAKSFREKALDLSASGTKKADVDELNALLKLAKQYGASDEYLSWLSAVCGYN